MWERSRYGPRFADHRRSLPSHQAVFLPFSRLLFEDSLGPFGEIRRSRPRVQECSCYDQTLALKLMGSCRFRQTFEGSEPPRTLERRRPLLEKSKTLRDGLTVSR